MEEKRPSASIKYESESFEGDFYEDITPFDELEKYFRFDVVYRMLENAGYSKEIATDEMRKELVYGHFYKIDESARITHTDANVIRNWLNGTNSPLMPQYLVTEKQLKFRLVPAETVYKIRLVFLANKYLEFPINKIANIGVGNVVPIRTEIVNPAEHYAMLEEEKAKIEEANNELKKKLSLLTPENLSLMIKMVMKEQTLLPENNEAIKGLEKEIKNIKENDEETKKELEAIKEDINNSLYRQAEENVRHKKELDVLEREREMLENRGLLERIFNKKITREKIEVTADEKLKEYINLRRMLEEKIPDEELKQINIALKEEKLKV